jgi:hypothetical protein
MKLIYALFIFVILVFSLFLTVVPVGAWENYTLPAFESGWTNIDLTVPAVGFWSGYPVLLYTKGTTACLDWISDPEAPQRLGTFPRLPHPRLAVDHTGRLILADLTNDTLTIWISDPAGWLPPQIYAVTGQDPCIRFEEPDLLMMDYCRDLDLMRCQIHLDEETHEVSQIAAGWDFYHNDGYYRQTSRIWHIPGAVDVYLIMNWDLEEWGTGHQYHAEGFAYGTVVNIPQSYIEEDGWFTCCWTRQLSAAGVQGGDYIAAWSGFDDVFTLKTASSELIDIGTASHVATGCLGNGVSAAAWNNGTHLVYKKHDTTDGWLPNELIADAPVSSIAVAPGVDQDWIIYKHDSIENMASRNPVPGTPTPNPNWPPTYTPTPSCQSTSVTLEMSSHHYRPGNLVWCDVIVCNSGEEALKNCPLFVILDVVGEIFFAPSFSSAPDSFLGSYSSYPTGSTRVEVFPVFSWPNNVGSASGLYFYAGLTNPAITELIGEMDTWVFSWSE